jgi:quinoprotein glucose dehydrogenase
MKKLMIGLMAACLPLAASLMPSLAGPSAKDWPAYGHDAGGGRFSPLTQITPQNVSKLQVAWTYHMNPVPAAPFPPPQRAGGELAAWEAPCRVVALDHQRQAAMGYGARGRPAAVPWLAYWPATAHTVTHHLRQHPGKLIALEAKTGAPAKGFGDNGVVETKTPEIMNGLPDAYYGYSSPPGIYKNLAIFGSRVQESPSKGAAGDVRAYDGRTDQLLWSFDSIHRPGEKFHDRW